MSETSDWAAEVKSAQKVLAETHVEVGGTGERVAQLEKEITRLRAQVEAGKRLETCDINEAAFAKRDAAVEVDDSVILTGAQIREALDFVNPDGERNTDQLECSLVIKYQSEEVVDQETGERCQIGYYAHFAEHPEEGSIHLSGIAPRTHNKRDAAVEPHLRTPDGKIILFPCGSNVLLVDDDGMELVSVYSGKHTRYLDVYEQSFVRAALNSNTHPNTDDCRSYC